MSKWLVPLLAWLGAVVVAGAVVLVWTHVVFSSASRIGGEQATVISAVSLQVALLAVFFLVVTFGLATLGFLGYRQIEGRAVEEAKREAKLVAEKVVFSERLPIEGQPQKEKETENREEEGEA